MMTRKQQQRLISMVNDHLKMADDDEVPELERLLVAVQELVVTPEPLGPVENIGSCDPGPDMRKPLWDKTGKVWHTDVDKVGRYSVRRPGLRQDFRAYLNGNDLGLMPSSDPEVLKRSIDRRILEARRINHVTGNMPYQSPVGAGEKAPRHTTRPIFGKR